MKPEPPQEEPSVQADNTDVFGEADLQMQEDTALPEGVFDDALFGSMDMGMSEEPELSEKEKIHIRQMRIAGCIVAVLYGRKFVERGSG